MRLVVDTGVIISALIKDSTCRTIIHSGRLNLMSMNFSLYEVDKHIDYVSNKVGVSREIKVSSEILWHF